MRTLALLDYRYPGLLLRLPLALLDSVNGRYPGLPTLFDDRYAI